MQAEAYKKLHLLKRQLQRILPGKVVIAPTSIKERGVIIKLSMTKTHLHSRIPQSRQTIIFRLAVEGTVESQTGLEQALRLIEKINTYFAAPCRLQDETGSPIPNTRITQELSPDDSFIDNPDGTTVQDVLDERLLILYSSR